MECGTRCHAALNSKHFPKRNKEQIADYCQNGGNILVSGAFVGTDLWDNPYADKADRTWAQNTLKYQWRNNYGAVKGRTQGQLLPPFPSIEGNYEYFNELNSESYVVENPDAIEPADEMHLPFFDIRKTI